MSGILGQFSLKKTIPNDFKSIIESSLIGRQKIVDINQEGDANIGLVSTPGSSASVTTFNNGELIVYVDGYFVEAFQTQMSSAAWFLARYLEKGENCICELNGSFNLMVYNIKSGEVMIATDRHGTRPLFYVKEREGFSVSYRAEILVGIGSIAKKLNPNLIANMLSHSRVWINNETFYQDVNLLPAKSIVKWSVESGLFVSSYTPRNMYEGVVPSVKGLTKVFKEVISDFSSIPNVGLSLSGGLDSRILLAAGFKGNTFTWGYEKTNDEIKLAEQCAKTTHNPWDFIHLTPESFLDSKGEGDKVREGLDLFVQAYAFDCYPQLTEKGITGLMTGLALDATMAGSYNPEDSDELDVKKALRFVFSKTEYFSEQQRKILISSDDIKSRISTLDNQIECQLIEKSKGIGYLQAIQVFFTDTRIRRWIFQRQMWQRAFVEDYIPTYDNRLIDYLTLFSLEDRANHKLFQKVLSELSEQLSEIPYQGTSLPPSAPISFWGEARRLEEQKEQLARDVFYRTNGEVFVSYNRYYSNFDEWFRMNSSWQAIAEDLLLSEDTLITNYVYRDEVLRMLTEQKSGKKTHFGRLIILMSLEKTLRAFENEQK